MIPDGMLAKVAGSNQFKVGQGDKTWNELEYVASIAFGSGLALDADGKIIVDFSQMPTDKFEALIKQIRVPIWLTKHTNFYVDGATGSDVLSEGRGLSADKAFKTIQACVNYVCDNYNLSRYNATINIAEGLYVENVGLPKYNTAGGRLFISGAGTDKTTVQGCFHGSTVPNGTFTIGYLTVTYADFSASV